MATERELKLQLEERFYEMEKLIQANEEERAILIQHMYEKAKSGMTAEEIDAVKERVARAMGRQN